MILRNSPSGPVVKNSGGGPFEPGTGAMLRLSEGTTAIGGSLRILTTAQTIGTQLGGGTVLVAELAKPNPELNYRATLLLDVQNTTTNASAEVQLFIDTSVDGGATWVEEVANAHSIGQAGGSALLGPETKQVRLDMTLRLGKNLGGPVLANSPSLRVRGRVAQAADVALCVVSSLATSGEETGLTGSVLLQLTEHY